MCIPFTILQVYHCKIASVTILKVLQSIRVYTRQELTIELEKPEKEEGWCHLPPLFSVPVRGL